VGESGEGEDETGVGQEEIEGEIVTADGAGAAVEIADEAHASESVDDVLHSDDPYVVEVCGLMTA